MPAKCSCLLCGLSIEDYTSSHLEGWTHEYRTVYRNDGRTFVSGVARYDGDPVWRVPKDPALRWDAVQDENGLLKVPVMKAPAVHGLHGFVLHDACWNLLQRFPGASDLSLERLLSVCESLPFLLWLNGLGWGHNYEGLFRYWPEGFYPWLEQFRVTGPDVNGVILGALANPFNGPGIGATLSSIVAKAPSLKNPGRPLFSTDCFSRLPWELCQIILLLLPTNDALNLRLASRVFLPLFSIIAFWQSRFLPDGERGFLFEARDKSIYNNLGKLVNLYRLTRRSVAAPDILNRERVWHLAQRLLVLTKPPLICNISGTQADDLDPQGWHSICSMVRMGDSSRGGIIRDIPRYPTTTIEIKVPSGAVRVGIAVVDTGVWDYVTGIRLIDQSGKSEFAGYLFEENEQFFDVVALHGLRVAMGRNGLRALQLVGPEQHTSRWAGRTEEVPISERLVVNRQITNLRVTLDGYKITAIAVHAKQPDEGENMAAQAASLRHTEIWYPDIPPENLLLNEDSFIGSDTPSTVYEPLSWILFGGDRGDKLPFVRGLLYTHVDGLRGLQFEYDDTADETCRDASPVRLGHFEDRQPPFSAPLLSIKGARGERICSLSIGLASLEYDARPGLLRHGHPEHFAITTNKGRIKKIGKRTEMMKMHEITVASGTTITGLYGHFDLECGMVNIGVISERL